MFALKVFHRLYVAAVGRIEFHGIGCSWIWIRGGIGDWAQINWNTSSLEGKYPSDESVRVQNFKKILNNENMDSTKENDKV